MLRTQIAVVTSKAEPSTASAMRVPFSVRDEAISAAPASAGPIGPPAAMIASCSAVRSGETSDIATPDPSG